MRLRTLIARSPALWLAPVMLVLGWLHIQTTLRLWDPYGLAATSAAASSIFLIAAICGACAAWEGRRLRQAGWTDYPWVRSWIAIAWQALRIPLGVAVTCLLVLLLGTFSTQGLAWSEINPGVLTATMVTLLAHLTLGFALGVLLPSGVAVPAMLLFSYIWMVMPIAMEPLWVRHLTGVWISCCSVHLMVAPAAVAGTIIASSGLLLGALCCLYVQKPWRWLPAIGIWILLWSIGAVLVRNLGVDPAVPRVATMVCSQTRPVVCVWPEHREQLETAAAMAQQAAQHWTAAGLEVPREFNELDQSLLPADARSFGFSLRSQPSDILRSLAYAMLPPFPDCNNQPYLGGAASSYVLAWMDAAAGQPENMMEPVYGPEVVQAIHEIRSLEPAVQRRWLNRNLAALRVCDLPAQLEPEQ